MIEIIKIWFDSDFIYGEDPKGKVHKQSLLWYPRLKSGSDEDRSKYIIGIDGIHWRHLDEDVSFESFGYEDAVPSKMQKFFLTHPEISVSGFAKSIGLSVSLLKDYINGFKKPSEEKENEIMERIHTLGVEMASIANI